METKKIMIQDKTENCYDILLFNEYIDLNEVTNDIKMIKELYQNDWCLDDITDNLKLKYKDSLTEILKFDNISNDIIDLEDEQFELEYIKTLEKVQNKVKKANSKLLEDMKEEELKCFVPTDMILETLKPYEIGVPKNFYKNENVCNVENASQWLIYQTEMGLLEYIGIDNTYNHNGKVLNDFSWETYKNKNGEYYILLSIHLGGDIRENYTEGILLKFDYALEFIEIINEVSTDNANEIGKQLVINDKNYLVVPYAFNECYEVYCIEDNTNIYGICEIGADEVIKKEILEKIKK